MPCKPAAGRCGAKRILAPRRALSHGSKGQPFFGDRTRRRIDAWADANLQAVDSGLDRNGPSRGRGVRTPVNGTGYGTDSDDRSRRDPDPHGRDLARDQAGCGRAEPIQVPRRRDHDRLHGAHQHR